MTDTQTFHDERNPMLLSFSGIQEYLTCRHRWRLRYVYGVKTAPGVRALDLGSAVHEGLAYVLSFQGSADDGVDVWKDRTLRSIPDDEPAFDGTRDDIFVWAEEAKILCRLALAEVERMGLQTTLGHDGTPYVEKELQVPLLYWDGFAGHIDWVAHDPKRDRYWVVDFKTRSSFYDDETEDVNLQNALYQYLALEHGIPVDGTLTFQIRSTVPKLPKINKDGTVSRAGVTTTWDLYRQAVVDAGQDPNDYLDMRRKLEAVRWVQPIEMYRSEAQVRRIWDTVVRPLAYEMGTARNMLLSDEARSRIVGVNRTPRNLSPRTCNGCGVRDICLAGVKGYDVTDPIRRYRTRDRSIWQAVEDDTL